MLLTPEKQDQIIELLIGFLMQFVITAAVLIVAHNLLLSLGFTPIASAAGALALLFGTTCLQYVQMAQENELLLAPFQLRFRYPRLPIWGIRAWLALAFCVPLLLLFILRAAVVLHWNRARSCLPVAAAG